jgi:hypothetical protein
MNVVKASRSKIECPHVDLVILVTKHHGYEALWLLCVAQPEDAMFQDPWDQELNVGGLGPE